MINIKPGRLPILVLFLISFKRANQNMGMDMVTVMESMDMDTMRMTENHLYGVESSVFFKKKK